MEDKLAELNDRENELYLYYGGHIPEANDTLNNLQRQRLPHFMSAAEVPISEKSTATMKNGQY